MKCFWTALICLSVLGGCKRAGGGPPAASGVDAPQGAAEAPPGKRLVCHKEKVIGSHQKREVCEWEDGTPTPEDREAREAYQDSIRYRTPTPAQDVGN
ncbi:MAG: hypothetical protein PVI30_20055 [Myxococcales bacterium]|jgi:hypothetical protein